MRLCDISKLTREIEILPGIFFTVRYPTDFDDAVAVEEGKKYVDGLDSFMNVCTCAGLLDASAGKTLNEQQRKGAFRIQYVKELGKRVILSWRGVKGPEGDMDLPVTPESVTVILNDVEISDIFYTRLLLWQRERLGRGSAADDSAAGQENKEEVRT